MKRKRKVLKAKKSYIEKKKEQIEQSLEMMAKINFNISLKQVKYILLGLAFLGLLIGLVTKNIFLMLILIFFLPWVFTEYLYIKKSSIQTILDNQIIKYAGLIKNAYIGNQNIKQSIILNIPIFDEPIKTLFQEWIEDIDIYNYSYKEAFDRLNAKFESKSLKEFTDQLIMCERDRTYMTSLEATVGQLNDRRAFMTKWEFKKQNILKKYFFMLSMIVFMTFVVFYGYGNISDVFIASSIFKPVIAIYMLIILLSTVYVLKQVSNVKM